MAEEKTCKTSLELLDDDILLRIIEKLQDCWDKRTWSEVCKQFYRLESLCRRKIQLLRDDMLQPVLKRYRNIEQLDLSLCSRIDDRCLQLIATILGPRLLSINLSKLGRFGQAGLSVLVTGCENLVEIDVSCCPRVGDKEAAAISECKNLRTLKMVKCQRITDLGLSWVAVRCNSLCYVNLKWCIGLTDLGVELVAVKCREIRYLDLSFLPITNKSIASITQLSLLESLIIVGCVGVNDGGLALLRNGSPSLQRLDVSKCKNVTCNGLMSLANGLVSLQHLNLAYCLPQVTNPLLSSLSKCQSLESIRFDGCAISNSELGILHKSCSSLKELGLSKCHGVTDEGICSLLVASQNLKLLDITCCRQLSDNTMLAVSKYCRGLSCLKMESCSLITENGFSFLGDNCHLLEELDLTDSSIADQGLNSISKCTELTILKLGFCQNVSDQGLIQIAACCSNLREIDLYRSLGVADNGLVAIARGCPLLRIVNLSYCLSITDHGVEALAQLAELQNLEIRGCFRVTSVGLSAVATGCKHLVELDVKRCYHLDDAGILTVVQCCPNLRQINVSYCPITDVGFLAMANLSCLQNVKFVHLRNVSTRAFEIFLLSVDSLKKVKLLKQQRSLISLALIDTVEARGCRIRWVEKPAIT